MNINKRTKKLNTARIMRTIWLNNGISRVEVARSLGLDKSTVTLIVNELIEMGLIKTLSEGESGPQGGRKPIQLAINRDYACVVGVEIQPESCTVLAVDLEGQIFETHKENLTANQGDLNDTYPIVKAFIDKIYALGRPVLGIAFGLSGIIDPFHGIIYQSIPLNIMDPYDFNTHIADKFDGITLIENDANCCAWGELTFHRNEGLKDFIFILIEFRKGNLAIRRGGIAVGFGIVIDGKVHHGSRFCAGEFRSLFWKENNITQFSIEDKESLNVEGDESVRNQFFYELSQHIALFVNTLDLSHVFIGGDVQAYQEELLTCIKQAVQKNWAYPDVRAMTIKFSTHGDVAVPYGAAGMLLDRLFAWGDLKNSLGINLPMGLELLNTSNKNSPLH